MGNLFHVSARDHSALILMAALAERYADEIYVSLHDVAEHMGLSEGYLEEVASTLKKAGLIQGRQGPGGGYRLCASPRSISLEKILTALEGPVELVDCQTKGVVCPVAKKCSSKFVWDALQHTIHDSLKKTTLAHVLNHSYERHLS